MTDTSNQPNPTTVPTPAPFSLDGKIAIVTGASRGIGAAIARSYAEAGAQVVLASRKIDGLNTVTESIKAAGGQAIAIAAHTGEPAAIQALVAQTVSAFGGVDILVNNAATNPHFGPLLTAEESMWDKTLEVNLRGYFRLIREVVPHMVIRGGGKVINVASIAGIAPSPGMGLYGITKAAVLMLTKTLALELAAENIQVNAIAPGFVKTHFSQTVWGNEALNREMLHRTPAARMAEPEEIAGLALYLASPISAFATGQAFVIDGGLTLFEVVATGTTDLISGLSASQVIANREKYGSNILPKAAQVPWWRQYLAEFRDPTIVILLIAAVVAIVLGLVVGEIPWDGGAILISVVIATTVGFVNQLRAEQNYEQLKTEFEKNFAYLIRDGRVERLPFEEIVFGDLVKLESGTLVPADGLIRQYSDLSIDTAPIDGESFPKVWGEDNTSSTILRGYRVVSGTALMEVTAVGTKTALWEQVISRLEAGRQDELERRTPLQERLDKLSDTLGRYGLLAALAILTALIFRTVITTNAGQPIILDGAPVVLGMNGPTFLLLVRYILVAVTIVVVAVPEGLPLAVTVSLALSARNIARDKVLVRSLKATEALGQADVICTDKTGTLTENRMQVQKVYLGGETFGSAPVSTLRDHPLINTLALAISLNSTAAVESTIATGALEFLGNATETALLAWLIGNGQDYRTWRQKVTIERQDSFSSTRKTMETVAHDAAERYRLVKGAPEIILAQCATIALPDGSAPIATYQIAIDQVLDAMSAESLRTLAVAYAPFPTAGELNPPLQLLAIFGLADPLRADVRAAIEECRSAGIAIKMVTGDNAATARAIAVQLDLIDAGGAYEPELVQTASTWRMLPIEAKRVAAQGLRVLARALPTDKEDLVKLLQDERQVVVVTGDGVNDSPALQRADVGVSMGIRGTDISKQASDLVLLDDSFTSLVRAIHWGRALYENLQRFIQFQMTINVSALAIIFFGALFGLTGTTGEPPLTVIQLLWINLIMDTFAVIALCLEPPTPDQMHHPPKGRREPFITPVMWVNILLMSVFFTVAILILTYLLRLDGDYTLIDSAIVFATYVFLQVFNEINARSLSPERSPLAGILRNRAFLGILVLTVAVQVIMTQIGGDVGAKVFSTAPLPLITWVWIALGSSTALIFGEIVRLTRKALNNRTALPQAIRTT